jgi:flagellar basal body-associated protein FliL
MTEPSTSQAPQSPEPPPSLQRALMDRARHQAAKDQEKTPRSLLQIVISIVLALAAVLLIGGAINAFLSAMQRSMRVMDEQEKAQEAAREAERRKAPIPAYVVPEEEKKK